MSKDKENIKLVAKRMKGTRTNVRAGYDIELLNGNISSISFDLSGAKLPNFNSGLPCLNGNIS